MDFTMPGQMPGMPASMAAINMPEQQSQQQGLWSQITGALGDVGQGIQDNPEQFAIALDTLGQNLAPENAFAGMGTAWGKSSLASKAEAAGQKKSQGMFQQLLGALTPGDESGPTSVTAAMGKGGQGIDYKVSGLQGLEEPMKMPGTETPGILTDKDFAAKFGYGGGY